MKFEKNLKLIFRLAMQIFETWKNANATTLGAATAFYTIFAVAPLFMLVLALAGFCFGDMARHELFDQVSGLIGQKSANALQSLLVAADRPRSGAFATVLGLAALFVGATSVFIQLQQALNAVWSVQPQDGWRQFIRLRLLSFATLLGIGFLLLVSLVVSAALAAAGKWVRDVLPAQEVIWQLIDFAVSLGLITVLFAMMFKILPDIDISWRNVWAGAFITSLLFTVGKFAIGLYLGRSSVSSAYGAAGSLVVGLLWVYYSVQILLFGAAITRVYTTRRSSAHAAE